MQILHWRSGTGLYDGGCITSALEGDGQQQPHSCLCMLKEQESGNRVSKVKTPDCSNAPLTSRAGSKVQRSGKPEIVVAAVRQLYRRGEMDWSHFTVVQFCRVCYVCGQNAVEEQEKARRYITFPSFFLLFECFSFSYLTCEVQKSGPSCSI